MNVIVPGNVSFPEGVTLQQVKEAAALGAEKIATVYESNRECKIVAKSGNTGFVVTGRFNKGLEPEFTTTGVSAATEDDLALKNNAKNPNPAIVKLGK